jgi:CRISPR-associated endonuclease/helicase Cas3
VRAFFEAAPPHLSEVLETRTREEIVPWLIDRAAAALKRAAPEGDGAAQHGDPAGDDGAGFDTPPSMDAPTAGVAARLRAEEIAAFLLSPARVCEKTYTLQSLADRNRRRELERDLPGRTLVVDARLGGLDAAGLLSAKIATPPPTLDGEADPNSGWTEDDLKEIGFRVRRVASSNPRAEKEKWRVAWSMPDDPEGEQDGAELRVELWRGGDATRGDPAIASRPQLLAEHGEWAAREAAELADRMGLGEPYRKMLIAAARAHDDGKARDRWQRAMGAPRDGKTYAKTDGRHAIPALLNGYRHEFGSLRDVAKGNFLPDAPEDLRELGLHLIASHHGFARPVIAAIDPEAPPSACAELARDAALRFARLQAEWGVWGLAWWEALLRAADWAASRKLNEDEGEG